MASLGVPWPCRQGKQTAWLGPVPRAKGTGWLNVRLRARGPRSPDPDRTMAAIGNGRSALREAMDPKGRASPQSPRPIWGQPAPWFLIRSPRIPASSRGWPAPVPAATAPGGAWGKPQPPPHRPARMQSILRAPDSWPPPDSSRLAPSRPGALSTRAKARDGGGAGPPRW